MMRLTAVLGVCLLLAACATRPPAEPRPVVPLPPTAPAGEPAGFIGLSSTDLRGAFGAPTFVRKESGAEMWRYDGSSCRAFFFLYPQGGSEVVRHVETVPRGRDIAADVGCLALLRGQPAAAQPPAQQPAS
jgi:hypothetical protein